MVLHTLSHASLTHYKSLWVRKFLEDFTKIFVPLFVRGTENLWVTTGKKKQNMLFYLTTILAVNISGNTCICLIKKKKKHIFKYHTKPIILLSTSFIYWK